MFVAQRSETALVFVQVFIIIIFKFFFLQTKRLFPRFQVSYCNKTFRDKRYSCNGLHIAMMTSWCHHLSRDVILKFAFLYIRKSISNQPKETVGLWLQLGLKKKEKKKKILTWPLLSVETRQNRKCLTIQKWQKLWSCFQRC